MLPERRQDPQLIPALLPRDTVHAPERIVGVGPIDADAGREGEEEVLEAELRSARAQCLAEGRVGQLGDPEGVRNGELGRGRAHGVGEGGPRGRGRMDHPAVEEEVVVDEAHLVGELVDLGEALEGVQEEFGEGGAAVEVVGASGVDHEGGVVGEGPEEVVDGAAGGEQLLAFAEEVVHDGDEVAGWGGEAGEAEVGWSLHELGAGLEEGGVSVERVGWVEDVGYAAYAAFVRAGSASETVG